MMYPLNVKQIKHVTGGCGLDNKKDQNQKPKDQNPKDKPWLFSLENLFKTAMTIDAICAEPKHLKRNSTGRFKTTSFK